MKIKIYIMLLILGTLSACDNEDAPFLTSDIPVDRGLLVVSYAFFNATNRSVNIHFNNPVNVSSIKIGESLILENDTKIGGFVLTNGGYILTLTNVCSSKCSGNQNCEIEIKLLGSTIKGIRSTFGKVLDGNLDGNDGGDYSMAFSVKGC